jgi:succinyl-diaminopimelate desuccinylase
MSPSMVNLGGLQSVRFGEKGTFRLTFTVWTVSANGAYRHVSRGANIVASQLVVRLLEIKDMVPELPPYIMKYPQTKEVRDVADESMGAGAADIVLQPTANIGVFNGGAKMNRIPKKAVFEADIRLPIGIKADVVLGNIKNILKDFLEASFEVQQAASNPANFGDRSSFSQHFTSSCSSITGKKPVMIAGNGGTDCKFWRYHGVPAYVYGASPAGMGRSNEAVLVEEFWL